MNYRRTQLGYVMLFALILTSIIFVFITTKTRLNLAASILMILILFILASMSYLTVSIDKKNLKVKFGYGIFHKKFVLKDIKSVISVRNPWYCGWGIRILCRPPTWLYNVSGFDAVEITLKNCKKYRIGTDEPKKLEQAIKKSI